MSDLEHLLNHPDLAAMDKATSGSAVVAEAVSVSPSFVNQKADPVRCPGCGGATGRHDELAYANGRDGKVVVCGGCATAIRERIGLPREWSRVAVEMIRRGLVDNLNTLNAYDFDTGELTAIVERPCPRCRAEAGYCCVSSSGRLAPVHAGRLRR